MVLGGLSGKCGNWEATTHLGIKTNTQSIFRKWLLDCNIGFRVCVRVVS